MNKRLIAKALLLLFPIAFSALVSQAQTTAFGYQGSLNNGGAPANGNYEMQFKLFDALSGGLQVGGAVTIASVAMNNGSFSTQLDFGAEAFAAGAARYLEISVRPAGSTNPFTMLSPRQEIRSAPFSVKARNAAAADSISDNCVGCVTGGHIASIEGSQVTGTIDAGQIAGEIPVASVPTGSGNYIQNSVAARKAGRLGVMQEGGFDIDGDGNAVGTLSGGIVNAETQFNLAGERILSNAGSRNLFVGKQAGLSNQTGSDNAFFGAGAGQENVLGSYNSYFGSDAGGSLGDYNSFFGASAGGLSPHGSKNTFIGFATGFLTNFGEENTFVGFQAGVSNQIGSKNSYFGTNAGQANVSGSFNAVFGADSAASHMFGSENAMFGYKAGELGTTGEANSFFGATAGYRTNGSSNSFFGYIAGAQNTTGHDNSFFGRNTGVGNVSGNFNTLIGQDSNVSSPNLDHATALGSGAVATANSTIQLGRILLDQVAIGALAPATSLHVCIDNLGVFASCSPALNEAATPKATTAAINEQRAQIERLEIQNRALQKQIDKLTEQLAKLIKIVCSVNPGAVVRQQ